MARPTLAPLPGFLIDHSDAPRFLNPQEIDFVLKRVPYVEAADITSSLKAHDGLLDYVKFVLEEMPLCPSALGEMIEELVRQFKDALVHPGMAAGVNGAEAVGAVTTQMTLNSFHSSGSADTQSKGIDLMQDLMYARKNPKNPTTYVYFKSKDPLGVRLSYREALETRRYLVATTMSKFVLKTEILERDEFVPEWWHAAAELPESSKVLRLHLNVDLLYRYHVTPAHFAGVWDRESGKPLVAQFSPISLGVVDLFPKADLVREIVIETLKRAVPQTANMTSLLEGWYLENVVIPELGKLRIGGIPDLVKINPLGIPVMSAVTQQTKVDKEKWRLYMNPAYMRKHNITLERVKALLEAVDISTIDQQQDQRGRVIAILVQSKDKPSDVIDKRIRDLKKTNAEDPLVILSEIMYLEATSTNLRAIRNHPMVDPDRTYCNNQYVMQEVLGCEPTYMFVANALVSATAPQGVSPIHSYLQAEFIMSRGYPYGTTYTGISRQNTGHMSLATVERAGEVFASHSLYHKSESTRNVSAAIMVGTRVPLGTGFCDVAGVVNHVTQGPTLYMNEDLYTAWLQDVSEQGNPRVVGGIFEGNEEGVDDEASFAAAEEEDREHTAMRQTAAPDLSFISGMMDKRDADWENMHPVKQDTIAGQFLVPDPRDLWAATGTYNALPSSPLKPVPASSSGVIATAIDELI